MANEQFKSDDYIYLRIINDFEFKERWDTQKYSQGEIIRYKRSLLIEAIASRQFGYVFERAGNESLCCVPNPNCDVNVLLYNKLYSSITVTQDIDYEMCLWPKDLLYINEWLQSHINPHDYRKILSHSKKVITDGTDNNIIEIGEENVKARISFKVGEVLDFNDPAVAMLFYDRKWFKKLINSEIIVGAEKEQLFDEDFSNAILAKDEVDSLPAYSDSIWSLDEYHYFIINDDININDIDKLSRLNMPCLSLSSRYPISQGMRDENGNIRVVWTRTSIYHSSDREEEQLLLEIARKATTQEAWTYHNKRMLEYAKRQKEESIKFEREQRRKKRILKKEYEAHKDDPAYFPGVNGEFEHVLNKKEQTIEQKKYSLEQIKAFYQNLSKINSHILEEMCFYGGTIPYILTDALESREFGDIDIFVPVPLMESLRAELEKQESFIMLYDSLPLAKSCKLTSRIKKEEKALMTQEEKDKENFKLLGLLFTMMNSDPDTVYEHDDRMTVDPLEEAFTAHRDYYNKLQDFGFKASLFGVNISVFPLYQYNNDIMAKSFNVNQLYTFLLGVSVLKNTQISDFVKKITIYGSAVKMVPLEYTLVSKRSAVDENYENRSSKDKIDIEYIMQHKEELGISDDVLALIMANYPDYSISIAYKINEDGTTDTLHGEAYKNYVLLNRGTGSLS